jgi:hypothetical protein
MGLQRRCRQSLPFRWDSLHDHTPHIPLPRCPRVLQHQLLLCLARPDSLCPTQLSRRAQLVPAPAARYPLRLLGQARPSLHQLASRPPSHRMFWLQLQVLLLVVSQQLSSERHSQSLEWHRLLVRAVPLRLRRLVSWVHFQAQYQQDRPQA